MAEEQYFEAYCPASSFIMEDSDQAHKLPLPIFTTVMNNKKPKK